MESGNRIESIVEYFRRADIQNPSMIDLFTEQAEMWFPKYGVIKGKASIARFGEVLAAHLQSLTHAIEKFRYHASGDVIVGGGYGIWRCR
jgi:hypothetical protein